MKKTIGVILSIIILALVCIGGYVKMALPDIDAPPGLQVELTPERIQRGRYLANNVCACMDCHATRDWTRFTGPPLAGTLGKGGEYFGPEMGFPGKFYSKNITPANLNNWTDGEVFRAITSGVDNRGQALFPVMPYPYYGKMDKEDVYALIAYIRSLPPVENETLEHEVDFPMNFILNTIPAKPAFSQRPDKSDVVAYGGYLVQIAGCIECHTEVKKGQIIPELAFSGGRTFELPNGVVRSANITPESETGIGSWTEAAFINRFKSYSNPASLPELQKGQVNTIMPWSMYAGMDTSDLKAIYKYLKTLKPIKNEVQHFTVAQQ
jgi:cytochrome c553